MIKKISYLLIGLLLFACSEEKEPMIEDPLANVVQDTTLYALNIGDFPEPDLPTDNKLTVSKVELGKMLFFETKLSGDGSQSCASCHNQATGFSDTLRFSLGIRNLPGKRQAMGVFNMAWNTNGFFWDGRAELLRHQALLPIEDALEMDETLENVIQKLSNDVLYQEQFIRAFGTDEVTEERMALALEQFMLSIVSNDSKYDKYLRGEATLTESETRGMELYFTEYNPFFPEFSGADCEHCHGGINFENDDYMNNGLDADGAFTDLGREEVTMTLADRGKFKVPSLRNIEITPPYMHDGRFKTLEEVIDHYDHGMVRSSSIDPALIQVLDAGGLFLSDQDKDDLINFLKTLTDYTFINNTEYNDPFE